MDSKLVAVVSGLGKTEKAANALGLAKPNEQFQALALNVDAVQQKLEHFSKLFSHPEQWNTASNIQSLTLFKRQLTVSFDAIKTIIADLMRSETPSSDRISILNKVSEALAQHCTEIDGSIATISATISATLSPKKHKWSDDLDQDVRSDFSSAWLIFNDPAKAMQISLSAFPKIAAQFRNFGLDGIYGKALMHLMCVELEKRGLATLLQQNPECPQLARRLTDNPALLAELNIRSEQKRTIPCNLVAKEDLKSGIKLVGIELNILAPLKNDLDKFWDLVGEKYSDYSQEYAPLLRKWLVLASDANSCDSLDAAIATAEKSLLETQAQLRCFGQFYGIINPDKPTHLTAEKARNVSKTYSFTDQVPPAFADQYDQLALKQEELRQCKALVRQLNDYEDAHPNSAEGMAWRITKDCRGNANTPDVAKALRVAYLKCRPATLVVDTIGNAIGQTIFGRSVSPKLHVPDEQDITAALEQVDQDHAATTTASRTSK